MADVFEVKGLDADLTEEDSLIFPFSQQQLMIIFEDIQVNIPVNIISIIHKYCLPGIVYIHTRDGAEFAVSRRSLALSSLLSIQAELKPSDPVHLSKGEGNIFTHVVKFLEYHGGVEPAKIQKPIRSVDIFKIVEDQWDANFANSLNKREKFQVILLANYIDCQSLLHLVCASIAAMIKGRSPKEINDILSNGDDEVTTKEIEPLRSVCMCGHVWDDPQTQEEAELKQEPSSTQLEENTVGELGDEPNQDNQLIVVEENCPNEAEDELTLDAISSVL